MDSDRPKWLSGDDNGVREAALLLEQGALVALPTETVYGLAARADSEDAVAAIYRAKGRPSFNPLIVHVGSLDIARRLAIFDPRADLLADALWPGPLTLVLPLREDAGIVPAVTAGLPTVALRIPDHPLARAVLERAGLPLAAPSANRSMGVSPTSPEHVIASLGDRIAAVLDGGACHRGLESTIVAPRDSGHWTLLREGPVTRSQLEALLGTPPQMAGEVIEAPGQLVRHYSPGKPVRLDAAEGGADGEYVIGFGANDGDCNLAPDGDLARAAARLYACLHAAAASGKPAIAVAPVPREGIGAAINDRLSRAAACE